MVVFDVESESGVGFHLGPLIIAPNVITFLHKPPIEPKLLGSGPKARERATRRP
jgi:hypothetical protein